MPDLMTQSAIDRKTARKTFSIIFFAVATYSALSIATVTMASIFLGLIGFFDTALYLNNSMTIDVGISCIFQYVVAIPVAALILRLLPKQAVHRRSLSVGTFLVIFLISRPLLEVGGRVSELLVGLIQRASGYTPPDDTTELVMNLPIWALILFPVILAPIMEELFFRKLLIDRLGVFGDKAAILVTSVIFGLIHGNLYQFVYAALLGLLLGYLYVNTGKLRYSIALHMLNNFLGTIPAIYVMKALERIDSIEGTEIPPELMSDVLLLDLYSILTLGLLVAGAVLFFCYAFRVEFRRKNTLVLSGGRMFSTAVFNLGFLVFFLLIAVDFVINTFPDLILYLLASMGLV